MAMRPGYLTSIVSSEATDEVLPGVIRSTTAPAVTGTPVLGRTLHASTGSWSITPDALAYQWYAGRSPIAGATDPTYVLTAADAGHRIHVRVTATAAGYTTLAIDSASTARVVLGRATEDKPTVTGRAVLGRTLHARVATFAPTTATPHYRWYRGHEPIHGARDATYQVRPADVGHRLHVVVTMRAHNWTPVLRRSTATDHARTVPTLDVTTSIRNGRVFLQLDVHTPGVASPSGNARVLLGTRGLGRFDVVHGQGSVLLARLTSGRHRLTVVYHGGARQTSAHTHVTVTVP
jgi:hypothetical protein